MVARVDITLFEELTDEQLKASEPYEAPQQLGPLRQCEREMRCASRGCGSSTFFKLQHTPYCMIHLLRRMNQMLIDLGVEQ